MQAITTKYLSATNTRGSRIKATCERGSISIPYPHDLSGDACHIAAADALVSRFIAEDEAARTAEDVKKYGKEKSPWSKPRVCGGTKSGCVHVFIS